MFKNKRKNTATPYLLISPGLLILTLGLFIPLIMLFSISFYKGIPGSAFYEREFTLVNYTRLFDVFYLKVLLTTFRIAIATTIASLLMGYPMALLIYRSHGAVKSILLLVVLTPLLTNVVARTMGLMIVLGNHGPINQLLRLFDMPTIKFITAELGIVIGLTQVFMPYMVLSINSVLSNIDFSLQEAARDLGSSSFGAFWKIILPLSVPGILAGSLFVFLLSFSSFVTPRLLGGGLVMVVTMLIYQQATRLLNWPYAAAAALVLLVISTILVTTYTRMASKGDLRQQESSADKPQKRVKNRAFSKAVREWSYSMSAFFSRKIRNIAFVGPVAVKLEAAIKAAAPVLSVLMYALIILFIIMPLPLVIWSSFSDAKMMVFPPTNYSFRAYTGILDRPEYIRAFLLSLRLALLSMSISLIVGTLTSLGLIRYNFPGREIIRSLFLSPLMLPAVIVGISLLRFLVVIQQSATFQGLMLAHLVLTSAYVVRTISSNLVGFDNSLEEAARDLGSGRWHTFRTITLPLIKPGLIVAAIFSFMTSFDETTVSIFIAGGRTITLPVRIYSVLEDGLHPTIAAISSLLIILALIAILFIGKVFGLEKFSIQ